MVRGPLSDVGDSVRKRGPAAAIGRVRTSAAAVGHDGNREREPMAQWLSEPAEKRDGLESARRITPQTDDRPRPATLLPPTENPVWCLEVRGPVDARRQVAPLRDDVAELPLAVTQHDLTESRLAHVTPFAG